MKDKLFGGAPPSAWPKLAHINTSGGKE